MFLRNNWYAAGFAADLTTTPVARRICGLPIVLFRTASGAAAALEDRCGHRGVPLSQGGECSREIIRCPYHGLEFDARGVCTKVPGQERIPVGLNVLSYPLVERDAMLWIWTGDSALADPAAIVSHPYHSDPAWTWRGDMLEVKAGYQLIVDNLLDLSHLQYVHRETIGGNPEEDSRAELKARREGNTVYVTRWMRSVTPAPLHKLAKGYVGKIDRWQEFECRPGILQFHSGAAEANSGALDEGRREHAMHIRHFHAVTPSTATSSLYFFSSARNFDIENAGLSETMFASTCRTFAEDKVLLEAQQLRLLEQPERPLMTIRNDVGIVHARRIMDELLSAQAAHAVPITVVASA